MLLAKLDDGAVPQAEASTSAGRVSSNSMTNGSGKPAQQRFLQRVRQRDLVVGFQRVAGLRRGSARRT